jgi:hypothetical protein
LEKKLVKKERKKMKKKYLMGSVFIALLMLVSTQFFLAPNAISYPTIHYGDAYIGEMWLSELDVSSVVSEFDDIAITHVKAFNEWVAWDEGFGNITVNWSINIQSTDHPEYYVVFGFDVFNIDNDSQLIGGDTYGVTIDHNDDYSDSGSLTVYIKFTEDEMHTWDDVTLVCSLGAFIQLNGTDEAKDFTCSAADRSVVAVDFEMPMSDPNYGQYLDEANYCLPPLCSWIDEWESHFSTESDMLNEQTFFQVGDDHEELQGYPVGTWRWGTVHCLINWFGLIDYPFEWSVDENKLESRETTWKVDQSGIVSGTVLVGVQVNLTREGQEGEIQVRGWFFTVETSPKKFIGQIGSAPENNIEYAYPQTNDVAVGVISARPYEHDKIDPEEKTIDMSTIIWLWKDIPLPKSVSDYHLHYDENAEEQETLEITPYYWEEACGYLNLTSEELSVDSSVYLGITTIEADITEALCEEGMPIYSFAADRGEMRVKFVC